MRPFALCHETTHGADAPGARGLVFLGRRLHEASPTRPESPESEHPCLGCVVLPEAILRCPGQNKFPFCPQFSTPPRSWGPPNSVLRAYNRFYTSGVALGHPPPWSIFLRFGRESFAVVPKQRVLLSTIAMRPPRRNKTNIQKRGHRKKIMNKGRETTLPARDQTLGGKRNSVPYGM